MFKLLIAFSIGFSLACGVAWQACPSSIDADGILREPFALIPLGALSTLVAVSGGAVLLIRRLSRR